MSDFSSSNDAVASVPHAPEAPLSNDAVLSMVQHGEEAELRAVLLALGNRYLSEDISKSPVNTIKDWVCSRFLCENECLRRININVEERFLMSLLSRTCVCLSLPTYLSTYLPISQAGDALLAIAAWHGRLDLIKLLLAFGAEVNARNGNGSTALHRASHKNNVPAVQLLLAHGADYTIRDRVSICHLKAILRKPLSAYRCGIHPFFCI
jgi:hypothetical protein